MIIFNINMQYSDAQLIGDYLDKGEEKSLEILVRRYLKPVYGFVYGYVKNSQEADDITQEVFVKVWKNLKKFDRQKDFKPWIFSIAKNTSLDFLKKKKAIPFSELSVEGGSAEGRENSFLETLIDTAPLPAEILERKDMVGAFAKAINKLLPEYRKTIFLHYNDDMTFREISEQTGEPLNTVKSRHRRALALLKKLLNY